MEPKYGEPWVLVEDMGRKDGELGWYVVRSQGSKPGRWNKKKTRKYVLQRFCSAINACSGLTDSEVVAMRKLWDERRK